MSDLHNQRYVNPDARSYPLYQKVERLREPPSPATYPSPPLHLNKSKTKPDAAARRAFILVLLPDSHRHQAVPRHRSRRSTPVPLETMRAALAALNAGMSFRKAAERFGITKSTLQRIKSQQRANAAGSFVVTVKLEPIDQ